MLVRNLVSKEGATFRFAVGAPDGPRSSTWRIWSQSDGEDPSRESVYVQSRVLGHRFKPKFPPAVADK